MPRPSRHLRVICVTVLAAITAAGCGSSGGPTAAGGLEKTNLVVAAVTAVDSAGVYIAEQRGLFTAQGLHVQIVPAVSSTDVISQQEAGAYDVTVGAYPSYILADAQHHAQLKVLAAGSALAPQTHDIVVPAGSPITKLSQLEGKTIGINAPNNMGTLLVDSLFADNGLTPKFKVKYLPFPDMGQALATHQLAAAWLTEPFITEDEEGYGVQPLADSDQGAAEDLPLVGYVVTQSWLNKYPHTAEAFRRAIERAQAIATSNPAAVQRAMTAFAGVKPMAAAILTDPVFPVQLQAAPLQRMVSLMVNFNMLSQGYNAREMIAKLGSSER
jgi:NitT/TauT family transport system substrate-binding protein